VKNRRSTDVIEMRDRVAIVAHCILNQAARAWWGEGGASREKGMVSDVVGLLARHGVGVIQMGCPEFSLYGNPRRPRSREESDTPEFREKCREIAIQARVEIEALMERGIDPEMEIAGILGFEGSPSCGVKYTTRTIDGERRRAPGQGHLIEALQLEMSLRGLDVPFLGVSLREDEKQEVSRRLEAILAEGEP
jgi:predicted secreted protein